MDINVDVVVLAQWVGMNQNKESFVIIFIYYVNELVFISVKDEQKCRCVCVNSSGKYILKSVIICSILNESV